MKQSQDKPMSDRSKVSSEKVPMSEKKGQFGMAIKPMGICMDGQEGYMMGYDHTAGPDTMEGGMQNPTGIGMGDGGPTDERAGESGKGL